MCRSINNYDFLEIFKNSKTNFVENLIELTSTCCKLRSWQRIILHTWRLMSYTLCRPSWTSYISHVLIVNEINKAFIFLIARHVSTYKKCDLEGHHMHSSCTSCTLYRASYICHIEHPIRHIEHPIHRIEHPIHPKYPTVYVLPVRSTHRTLYRTHQRVK